MITQRELDAILENKRNQIKNLQKEDGSWRFCFEGPPMTDAYFIIMAKNLNLDEEDTVMKCIRRLKENQDPKGFWRIYPDEPNGNLSATVEATLALILSGTCTIEDPMIQNAIQVIKKKGGLKKTELITRTFLAMNGLYSWPTLPVNPAWLVLLPKSLPFNFYSFSSYARAHFAPALVACEHQFKRTPKRTKTLVEFYKQIGESNLVNEASASRIRPTPMVLSLNGSSTTEELSNYWPELADWLDESRGSIGTFLKTSLFKLKEEVTIWKTAADRWIERYMLQRLSENGTLLNYASTSYLMIYGLLALGYSEDSTLILNAIKGIQSLIWEEAGLFHIQNSPSPVWDTALLAVSLLDAGTAKEDPVLEKAAAFLKGAQQSEWGDWAIHNPDTPPGGWGFSDSNTKHPDLDDTHVALRVMNAFQERPAYKEAFNRGVSWLLSMQNDDGGWAAFEKNVDQSVLALLPVKHIQEAALDPSTADLTGRTLFFFGKVLKWTPSNSNAKRAIDWLKNHQDDKGAWTGRWGVQNIYGTWAALTGLMSVGVRIEDPTIVKAVNWLRLIQNQDGGWGESCQSDSKSQFVTNTSTAIQTAWAVDALLSVSGPTSESVKRGVQFLIKQDVITKEEQMTHYPTGIGLPGSFYNRYHSYSYIWPLLTLSHYRSASNADR